MNDKSRIIANLDSFLIGDFVSDESFWSVHNAFEDDIYFELKISWALLIIRKCVEIK